MQLKKIGQRIKIFAKLVSSQVYRFSYCFYGMLKKYQTNLINIRISRLMKTIPILNNHLSICFLITLLTLIEYFCMISSLHHLYVNAYTFGRIKTIDVRHIVTLHSVNVFFSYTPNVLVSTFNKCTYFSIHYLYVALSGTV